MSYLNYTSTSFQSNVTNVTQSGLCPDDDGVTKPGGKLPTAPTWYAACGYGNQLRSKAYRYRLRVDEVSYDIDTNTGVYNFEFYATTGSTTFGYGWYDIAYTSSVFKYSTDNGASYEETKNTETKNVKVNGSNEGSAEVIGIDNKTHLMPLNRVTYLKIAHLDNVTLAHKSDGTLNITFEVKFGQSESWNYMPFLQTVTATFAATTIPRSHMAYVYDSSEWKKGVLYVYNGSSWVNPSPTGDKGIYVYDGSEWKQTPERG